MTSEVAELRLAATVILVRDGIGGVETLMLRRNPASSFLGDHWVFPGGAVEEQDGLLSKPVSDDTFKRAAVRETFEEAGVKVDQNELVPFSRWIAPAITAKRFDTVFYLAASDSNGVDIDCQEIVESVWMSAEEALRKHQQGELKMMPPTLVTLIEINNHQHVSDILDTYRKNSIKVFKPKASKLGRQLVMLYEGDAGYQSGDPNIEGDRHRCQLNKNCWSYDC